MKLLSLLIVVLVVVGCTSVPPPLPKVPKAVVIHYPRVVYNNCVDEYAIETDSGQYVGVFYFGKTPPPRPKYGALTLSLSYSVGSAPGFIGSGLPESAPPPKLTIVNWLHDTLKFTILGGEFQFKDSAVAMQSYLNFVKECKDTEDIRNIPIRKLMRERFVADSIQHHADSILESRRHIEDSIFKCKHTYQ